MFPLAGPAVNSHFLGMTKEKEFSDLAGKLLIAMPGMGDPRFARSVVFVCAHSDEGTLGLIVNKPSPGVHLENLLEQLEIPKGEAGQGIQVHFGGPVEMGRGFVLHSGEYAVDEGTLKINNDFGMTATQEILRDLAAGKGPDKAILMLGYSGWGEGQLESEILENGWLVAEATPDLVFSPQTAETWAAALGSLGVDPVSLSAEAGRA